MPDKNFCTFVVAFGWTRIILNHFLCSEPNDFQGASCLDENTNKLGFPENCLKTIFAKWNLKMIGNEEYRR